MRHTMKKVLALALCLCFTFLLVTACGLKEGEKGANIHLYLADFPQTLDPALLQANSDTTQLLTLLFEPLTRMDSDGKVKGALADDWYEEYDKVNQEYAIYFELNESQWSNGTGVTADDVIYAWKRILSPDTESPYASLLYCIKNAKAVKAGFMTSDDLGITAEDDHLLKVVFEDAKDFSEEEQNKYGIHPYVYDEETFEAACDRFVETVSNIHLSPVSENVVKRYTDYVAEDDKTRVYQWGDYSAASIVSNGLFKVQAFVPGHRLILERNNYYRYDEDNAVDKYVTPYRLSIYYYEGQLRYSTQEEHLRQEDYQAQRYRDGQIYMLSSFTKDTYNEFKGDMKTSSTTNGYAYLFNTKNIPEQEVRQALAAALDRNHIVNDVTGTGEIAATGYVPSHVFNTDRKSDDFRTVGGNLYADYNMDRAKELLGGKKKTYRMIYLIPDDFSRYNTTQYSTKTQLTNAVWNYNVYEDIANYAVERWAELGITVKATGMVYTDYQKALQEGDFDIIGYNVVMDSTDALAYLAPFATLYSGRKVAFDLEGFGSTLSYSGLESADYDAIIDRAAYTAKASERADALHEAERLLTDLCPATMLFYYTNNYVANSKLSKIGKADYYGCLNLEDLNLSDWRKINADEEEASKAIDEAFSEAQENSKAK
ncbi:MAG: peptide ABC transporter substrate-binding protein [Oscillospiraceae bacterium]|nr:peptide ABC transporter substrate-binding protein [Oscillospiraceae bacterium]